MSIIEFIGICGILVGISLPIVGTWRYFINNAALQRLDKRRLSFFIGINVFLVIIIIAAIIVSKTIAQPATTTTYTSLLIVGIVSTLIGIATFLYQTHVSARLNASMQIAEQQQTDDQDKDLKLYLDKLRNDPHITYIQILDMSRPLDTLQTYVDTRLARITTSHLKRDSSLQALWVSSDPNILLQASRSSSEKSTNSVLELEQAIRKYKHAAILGDPGSGKTTLLKYLTLKSLEKQLKDLPTLPIYVELYDFARSGSHDLLDFAASKWDERYGFPHTQALAYMQEHLQANNALVLLDALDETVVGETLNDAADSYQLVSSTIMQFANHYQEIPIVVTARKAGYQQHGELTGFTKLEVQDFRPEDIRQFVNNWFANAADAQPSANAQALNSVLERNPRIQTLASNPLLLSLIVIVFEAQLDIPDQRAELYKQCVQTLLKRWDATRDIQRRGKFKLEYKLQLLKNIAWYFHIKGQGYFPENELLLVINDFLPTVHLSPEQNRQILEEITSEYGLLKEQVQGWYGFLHLTLQEYFTAQYAVEQNQLQPLLTHLGDPWWEEVILLYAASIKDVSPLVKELIGRGGEKSLGEDIFHENIIMAGRCLAVHVLHHEASLEKTIVNRLQAILISTPYTLTRQQVAMALVEFDASKLNRHLLDLLSNEEIKPEVRQSVADALGTVGNRWLVADLPELLTNRQISYSVRERIVKALGKLGDRSITDNLLQLLSDPNIEPGMFELIIETLGLLGEPSIAPVLLRLLREQHLDVYMRASIASSLGRLGNRAIASELLQLLSDDQLDVNVRMNIATALGMLGERSIASELVLQLSKQPEEPFVQQRIALALGVLGESSVIPELLQLLANEQLALNVRTSIARTLGRPGNRATASATASKLLQLLTSERLDPQVAISIANTLSTLGETSVIPGLLTLLSDKQVNFNVRASIAATLGSLGVDSVIPDLLRFLSDEQTLWLVGQHITTALRTLGDRSVVPSLLQLLSDEQIGRSMRQWIADVLGTLGDISVVPSLVALLSDGRIFSFVRSSIADAIGTIGEASVAPALLSLLSDEECDLSVRQSITSALATLNNHAVLPVLFQLLLTQQEYPTLCESIANTIGQLADDEVSARKLAELLLIKIDNAEVEDTIHHALWKVSRRARTRVFITNSSDGKRIDMYNQKGTKISHPLEQDIQQWMEAAKDQQQDETRLSNSAEQDIQQWMESVSQNQHSQNQQQKKILIFDKKLQKLVPVAPDDPRLQDSTYISPSFGFEEAKRFGHEDTQAE